LSYGGKLVIKSKPDNLHHIYKSEIKPGIRLTCIQTDRFKAGCITVNLLDTLSSDTAAANALLPRVLRRGTASYPDMESLAAVLDDMYGVRIEPIVRKRGELHSLGFYIDFPDERYIPGSEGVLERAVSITGEMLLSPALEDGKLREDYVESEKSNLIDDIRAAINDKRNYSVTRLLEEMCVDEPYGVSGFGTEEEAQAITGETLTEHYRKIVNSSGIEILYCGSALPQRVEAAMLTVLDGLPERTELEIPKTNIVFAPVTDEPRRFNEALDVSQGKLVLGFRMGSVMKDPDYPALMVFNALYGGSITSKLFVNVRERLSLCYYASSMLDKHKGVMVVSSGVEFSKYNTALDEILFQLDSIKRGDISDCELNSAKLGVVTSIRSALDRLGGLEELYFDSAVYTFRYDPAKLSDSVEKVTLKRVIKASSDIKPDSIYFLSGKEIKEGGNGL
jgi:predicted Zn-dependent peptidase